MQRLGGADRPLVIVDYAHTSDALEKVLIALRPTAAGELICVFGCGGDRDAGKRQEMGHIAARYADRVVVTSDNPRSEDPAAIANAVARGVRDEGNRRWTIELDRSDAIGRTIAAAKIGDVVLIAGKGHETYQEAQGVRTPFSDVVESTAALSAWTAA
jgi:UDP-N-acetylmuramoyl-L-alanyl-D-glutamate--2,6-diaminopimelate ligase